MKRLQYILILFILLFGAGLSAQEVEGGQIDLSGINFHEDVAIPLDGDWHFRYEELLTPDSTWSEDEAFGQVPGFWQRYEGRGHSPYGYASYRLKVRLPSEHPLLALKFTNVCNSYRLWVNGKEYQQYGVIGVTKETTVPCQWRPQIVRLQEDTAFLDIVIQVSNFHHRNGGFQESVILASSNHFQSKVEVLHFADMFLAGSLAVIALFFFGMYLFWREDKAALFFALFASCFSILTMVKGTRALVGLIPSIPWHVEMRIEYTSMFLAGMFMVVFVDKAFPNRLNKTMVDIIRYYYLLLVAIVMIFPMEWYSYTVVVNNIIMLCLFVWLAWVFTKAFKDNVLGARWAIISTSTFFVTICVMVFDWVGVISVNPVVTSIGLIAFVLSMSLIFASRFSQAFYDVKELQVAVEKDNLIIENQMEELTAQTEEIQGQQEVLEGQHELITDSINYAQRIQKSMLTPVSQIQGWLKESFVYFKPQNVVSGDFYFARKVGDEVIVAIADCTGHGVPGAMLSLVGISTLDQIVLDDPNAGPSKMLTDLNYQLRRKMKMEDEKDVRDSLDIILARINPQTLEVRFSAAHHKLTYISSSLTAVEYKGDSHFIGDQFRPGFEFTEHEIQLSTGDQIFMFSDGSFDQKGGPDGRRLYYQRLQEWLMDIHPMPVSEQEAELEKRFSQWMGIGEQIDDMLVFGWKVPS